MELRRRVVCGGGRAHQTFSASESGRAVSVKGDLWSGEGAQLRGRRALRRHDWVVYAKTPLAGPVAVLD